MSITVRPLSEFVGAEIGGVDLSRELTDAEFEPIKRAWAKHKVLVFHGQKLTTEQQLRFAQCFGPLQNVRSATAVLGADQPIMHVANRPVDGKPGVLPDGEMQFHTDQCYYERPSRMSMLFAIEIPKSGGNTMFLNAAAAFAALPEARRQEISRYKVKNIYDYSGAPQIKSEQIREDAPTFVHPLVIRHPETGEPVLYVNRLMSECIVDLPKAESDKLIAELVAHAEQRKFIYEHVWTVGDVVMWDNFACMHARTDFDPAEARILRRCGVQGPRPEPAFRDQAA
jgi:taurine dioxygenase